MIARSTTFRFAALVFAFQLITAAVLLFGPAALLRSQSHANAIAVAETMQDDLVQTYASAGLSGLAHAIDTRVSRRIERAAAVLLTDPSGKRIAGNLDKIPAGLAVNAPYEMVELTRSGHASPEAILMQSVRLPGGAVLVTGTVIESERQILALLKRTSMIALALSVVLAAFAAFVSTRLILNRLKASVSTLRAVRAGDLGRRVPRDETGDAFALLGSEVNQALDRVASLNDELKLATDGLAHDLRSPLTRMRAALDRLAEHVDDEAAQPFVDQALAETERLMAMIETALNITRAEAGIGRESFIPGDLSELLNNVAEIYAPLVEDQGRAIVVEAPAAFEMPVHRQLLDQTIGNLIDNTLKYGAGTITLSLRPEPDGATISVADEGPGIAPHDREQALRRFSRLDQARRGWGAGLGLSLVQAVAHLHDGTVDLRDAAPGLDVVIRLRIALTPALPPR
ncbi:sensor histidine kinase [Novosphingobium sp. Leaf2]|uniref:sensor histidine kinase n=1 Tax=Novosphingobium sp. Leaf2 TaxID=1735670 RepID=UPI0006F8F842|nr:HAMP domain-containing sensor histidine kinase [Novosphingobium sp. Leaf2]KQM19456.1 histidine kinase [Novosphingobium sp. Leaf2]